MTNDPCASDKALGSSTDVPSLVDAPKGMEEPRTMINVPQNPDAPPNTSDSALYTMPSLVDSPLLLPAEGTPERSPGRMSAGRHPSIAAASTTSTVPSTSVASLIQSAAKLSLDAPQQPKLFQDDEYDDFVSSLFAAQKSPNLKSLQQRVLPILPDEQDRKRFIGCLAAVIVSLHQQEDATNDQKHTTVDSEDGVVLMNDPINDLSSCFYEDEEDEDEENFDYFEEVTEGASSRPPMRSGSNSVLTASSSSMGPLGSVFSRTRAAALRAQARHRKRSYDIFARFLVAATEQLGLEKGHGRCFLPMLEPLLGTTTSRPPAPPRSSFHPSESSARSLSYNADYLQRQMDEMKDLRPFLEVLGPGAGIRCITMLLLQHLLNAPHGYDARIRHVMKTVGVLVIMHDMVLEQREDEQLLRHQSSSLPHTDLLYGSDLSNENHAMAPELLLYPADLLTLATRKFESLEHCLATKLIEISNAQQQQHSKKQPPVKSGSFTSREMGGSARDKLLRGLKIGGTAVAAGTLFAITGGLAAPGIAAGIAAVVGTTGVATMAVALTTTAAVTTIFGVGGGSLVAYKMTRRTVGLTEFEFQKETSNDSVNASTEGRADVPEAELFCTVCISGWLRDDCDFQRPWGLSPTRPPIDDRLELLERFYSVYRPGHVPRCEKILDCWKNEEKQLWKLLRQTYGRDPDHLFPLNDGPKFRGSLSLEQREVVERLLEELGCSVPKSSSDPKKSPSQPTSIERMLFSEQQEVFSDSRIGPKSRDNSSNGFDDIVPGDETDSSKIKHLATVWDYHATYGGELYTIRWESDLLEELCMSVIDLAADVVTGATTHLLKFTVLSTLAAALAVPVALKSAANMIDGTWTLVVERSDLAGKELAQSLLFSTAGNRPVTLVGFSFGARVIYACLKELARYQEKWEDFQERQRETQKVKRKGDHSIEGSDEFFRKMREPASIVGDVILMGLPNHLSHSSWQACRQVVAGRFVNCFSRKDLILSLMFQYKKFGFKPVCGTCAVDVAGVENFDVSDLVSGHQDYCLITGDILKRVRLGQPFKHDNTSSSSEKSDGEEEITLVEDKLDAT